MIELTQTKAAAKFRGYIWTHEERDRIETLYKKSWDALDEKYRAKQKDTQSAARLEAREKDRIRRERRAKVSTMAHLTLSEIARRLKCSRKTIKNDLEVISQKLSSYQHIDDREKWMDQAIHDLQTLDLTIRQIAVKNNVSYATLLKTKQRLNIKTARSKNSKKNRDQKILAVIKDYKNGMKQADIAEKHSLSVSCVRTYLSKTNNQKPRVDHTETDKKVHHLYFKAGLKKAEIARQLQLSKSAVDRSVKRAEKT